MARYRHAGSCAYNSDVVDTSELRDGDLELELTEFGPNAIHKVPTYDFRMVHATTREALGGIRLRTVSTPHVVNYAGHIGYLVHPLHRGRHYAARSVRLLLPMAWRLGIDPLWITCDPENYASQRTAQLAGAQFAGVVQVPADCIIAQSGHPRKCRYRLGTAALS